MSGDTIPFQDIKSVSIWISISGVGSRFELADCLKLASLHLLEKASLIKLSSHLHHQMLQYEACRCALAISGQQTDD